MSNIKELFFNTVCSLTKSKSLNYYFYKDFSSKQNRPSIILWRIYSKKINRQIYFFQVLETIYRIARVDTQRIIESNNIYYFGNRPSFYSNKTLIGQNFPNIPYLNKNMLFNAMIAFSEDCISQYKMQYPISKRIFIADNSLFHRVNFLSERVNNWILCSIFIWRGTADNCNNKAKSSRQILHIYGIYKFRRSSLSVELLFGKRQISERAKDKNHFRLLINNKKYSIIVRMGEIRKKDRLNYKKEIKSIVSEIIENLKYYSISD